MPAVVGIRFKDSGKTYFFAPNEEPLAAGDIVIVDTVRGLEMAKVAFETQEADESEIVGELRGVVRKATASDFERLIAYEAKQEEALTRCSEKVSAHELPMKLVKAEYSFDGSRLTFYFTADNRVDFRNLVRDLAHTFRTRIELRQIGPRDEAKLLGGIGPCGRLLCCATFLPDYAKVSIKMAKDQDLPLTPNKISGVCGRLLCCISYEHTQYLDMRNELPKRGDWVQTPDGPGEVVAVNLLKQLITVQVANSDMETIYEKAQISEAADRVGSIARSRNAEGITPARRNEPAEANSDDFSDADIAALEDNRSASAPQQERRPQRPGGPPSPGQNRDQRMRPNQPGSDDPRNRPPRPPRRDNS